MKISTPKTKIMCMSRQPVQFYFQTNGVTLQKTEKFKYLGVTLSSDARGRSTGHSYWKNKCSNAPALPISVLRPDLCTKAKLSVFRLVFVPILTYDHECWVITETVRSRVQAAEMVFLLKIRGLSLLDKLKSTDICQSLNIEPLLLRIEQLQLR